MARTTTKPNTKLSLPHPLMSGKERLVVWERARGMWKNRKPDPIKELSKMRKEWDRKLPKLNSSALKRKNNQDNQACSFINTNSLKET